MTLDVARVRARFPALNRPEAESGRLPVFLDNPAGTQVPQPVIAAFGEYYRRMNANSGGSFATSRRSDAMVAAVREQAADFLNAPRAEEIVFGANMTTLNFVLARALAQGLRPGDELVVTCLDHDANVAPWRRIAAEQDLELRLVDLVEPECALDLASLEAALSARTRVVATTHASNACGTLTPLRQIAAMAHAVGALHVVDAVQGAPHVPLDVQAIGCDFLLCSAYKFYGPHLGLLWGRRELLESLPVEKVRPARDVVPWRWETGTPAFESVAALGAAFDYLAWLGCEWGSPFEEEYPQFRGQRLLLKTGMCALAEYERELCALLIETLLAIPGLRIAGVTEPARMQLRVPTVACALEGRAPVQIAEWLGARGIYVWAGDFYAHEFMQRLGRGSEGMLRVGLTHYNTAEEILRLGAELARLAEPGSAR